MYLGLYKDHFMAICNPDGLASLLKCELCGRIYYRTNNFNRHQTLCDSTKKVVLQNRTFHA